MGISDFFKGLSKEIKDNRIENDVNHKPAQQKFAVKIESLSLSNEKISRENVLRMFNN